MRVVWALLAGDARIAAISRPHRVHGLRRPIEGSVLRATTAGVPALRDRTGRGLSPPGPRPDSGLWVPETRSWLLTWADGHRSWGVCVASCIAFSRLWHVSPCVPGASSSVHSVCSVVMSLRRRGQRAGWERAGSPSLGPRGGSPLAPQEGGTRIRGRPGSGARLPPGGGRRRRAAAGTWRRPSGRARRTQSCRRSHPPTVWR